MGDPGGSYFRPWTLPGRPQGARGANFKPSWANPFLDFDSGPQKSPKKLNFEGARTSKIALAPRRECNFHFFTTFTPEPENRRFWELFWKPSRVHVSLWAPLGVPWGVPEATRAPPCGPQGSQQVPRPPQEVPRPPDPAVEERTCPKAPGPRILCICRCIYVHIYPFIYIYIYIYI